MSRKLFNTIGEWSNRTFGNELERNPVGPLKHLAKEVCCEILGIPDEHVAAMWPHFGKREGSTDIYKLEEYADVLILLMDATRRAGHSWDDLMTAAVAKHAINTARTYPKPTGDEISEHVRT